MAQPTDANTSKGNYACIKDCEYMHSFFMEHGHFDEYYIYEVTPTHALLHHPQSLNGIWMDRRAIYSITEKK